MKHPFRWITTVAIGVLVGLSLSLTASVFAERDSSALPLKELRTFTDAYARIKSDYVIEVDDKELLENAIRGMLSGLDPHSNYLNPEEFKELKIGTSGEFGGLGIEVGMEDGFVKVVSPIDDTPAARAGLQAGDLIIRLDDTPVKGMTLNDAVKLMRGKPGTDIDLTIVRTDSGKPPFVVTVTRDIIQVRSVKSRSLEPGFGYVRITNFQSTTTQFLLDAIDQLRDENDGKLKGLVLDLRNNPGGVLNGAVGVSDAFLDDGLIVYTEGRIKDSRLRYSASSGDELDGAPLVVLVNGGSASASEIVAGALQDHSRAVLMGTRTFGKGSVQTIQPLSNDTALKITTARYFTPNGRSIQAEGIVPDILLDGLSVEKRDTGDFKPVKEANLSGHLENDDTPKENESEAVEEESLAVSDFQLFEALNMLKGMSILNKLNKS